MLSNHNTSINFNFAKSVTVVLFLLSSPVNAYQVAKDFEIKTKFFSNLSASENHKDNGFHLKRSYLTLKSRLDDTLSFRFTLDQKTEDGKFFTKYAYADYKISPALKVRAGLVNTPYVGYDEDKLWGFRFVETSFTDSVKAQTSADLGINFIGESSQGNFGYQLSILNGEGYNKKTDGTGGAIAGRLNFKFSYLHGGLFFHKENDHGGNKDYDPTRQGVFLFVETDHLRFGGQYLAADDGSFVEKFNDAKGYNIQGRVKLPTKKETIIFIRFDSIDLLNDGSDRTSSILGASYKLTKNLTISPNVRESDDGKEKTSTYSIHTQLKF